MSDVQAPVAADVCCFCGRRVEHSDSEYIRLSAQWSDEGNESSQNWGAHRSCLAERMSETVAGTGPFFNGPEQTA